MHEGSPRILIVRPSALGDVARTAGVLVSLRRAYPQACIDWLVNEPFSEVIEHHPGLNHVVSFARDRLSRFGRSRTATREGFELARRLKRSRYDMVLDCQGLFRSGLLTWLTRAPKRIGLASAREGAAFAYTDKVRVDASKVHTVDRMLELVASLGHPAVNDLQLYVGPADQHWSKDFKREHAIADGGFSVVAPTAKWGCKCWPIEYYTALTRRLLDERVAGDHVVVLASPGEHARLQPLIDACNTDRLIVPTTTVGQMMALLSQCNLLIANDSAPLHIAVGFGRPLVAIFGPTDPATVGPYGRQNTVVQPPRLDATQLANYRRHLDDDTLIRSVEIETVWEKVVEQLPGD